MGIKLTITVQFFSSNEKPIVTDSFILSYVKADEVDNAFLEEFVECAIGEGTSPQFTNNVLDREFSKKDNFFGYMNLLHKTHDFLTGTVYTWKIINHKIENI